MCPYCEVSLYERRRSRSANSWNDNLAYCPNCAHRHYFPGRNRWQRACACQPCLAAREQARQAKAIEQRKRIKEHWSLAKHLPVPLHTLSITRQLQLLAVLEIRMDTQTDCILAAEKPLAMPVSAHPGAWIQPSCWRCTRTRSCWLTRIRRWRPSATTPHQRPGRTRCAGSPMSAWMTHSGPASAPCIACCTRRCPLARSRNGMTNSPQPSSCSATKKCAPTSPPAARNTACPSRPGTKPPKSQPSYSTCIPYGTSGRWSTLRSGGAVIRCPRPGQQTACRQHHSGSLLSLSERAVREGWQFTLSSYDTHAPRSGFSRALFDVLLQQPDHGLGHKVSDYIAALPGHADDEGCRLFCAMCGSNLVHVKAGPRETIVNCKDCLARTLIST